jgi:hypothetical protein
MTEAASFLKAGRSIPLFGSMRRVTRSMPNPPLKNMVAKPMFPKEAAMKVEAIMTKRGS